MPLKDLPRVSEMRLTATIGATKPVPSQEYTTIDNFVMLLLKKFKPLWIRSVQAAQADIKGFIGMQIKNNAYYKADKKLERLKVNCMNTLFQISITCGWLSFTRVNPSTNARSLSGRMSM